MKQARRSAEDVWAQIGQFEVKFASVKREPEVCLAEHAQGQEELKAYYNQTSREFQAVVKEKDEALERLRQSESARREAELELAKIRQELQPAQSSVTTLEAKAAEAEKATAKADLRAEVTEK